MKVFEVFEFVIMTIVCVLCAIPVVLFGSMFSWISEFGKKEDE